MNFDEFLLGKFLCRKYAFFPIHLALLNVAADYENKFLRSIYLSSYELNSH